MLLFRQHQKEKKLSKPNTNILLQNATKQKPKRPQVTTETATPELDRLAARSQAAKAKVTLKRPLPKSAENDIIGGNPAPRKLALKRKSFNLTTPIANDVPNNASKVATVVQESPLNETTQKFQSKSNKVENKTDQTSKKKSGRIKLKRNFIPSSTLEQCKVKKSS